MWQVTPADGQAISVASDGDDGELRIGGFDSLGNGEPAAMNAVKTIGLDKIGQPAGAADSGNKS